MNRKRALAVLCAAAVSGASLAGAAGLKPMPPAPDAGGENLRVAVSASYKTLQGGADITVTDGAQANHVAGGEKHFKRESKAGTQVEFRKWGFVFNVLPVGEGAVDEVVLQLQVELSGPIDAEGYEVETWQLQTTVRVKKGVKTTISQAAGRLEVLVSDPPKE